MLVTKIEPQKHHKNRSSVYLDGAFAFGISNFDLFTFHLKEGTEITAEEFEKIKETALAQDARQYALRLLDARAYTEKALIKKLEERGTEPEIIEKTVLFLKEYAYLDDAAYAARYVQAAVRQGKSGRRKIYYDLIEKGIAKELTEEAVNSADLCEEENVLPILEKRLKGDFSFNTIMKAKRYLLSRGFSYEAIDRAIRQLTKNEEEWFDA
ncbi:MAG: regulatory protein RecX [Clostridia bacterium]|nr:regulatory protein RecX [Clostridia bacterium]